MKEQEKIHHMLQSRDEANEIKYFNRHAESSKKIFKDLIDIWRFFQIRL